jgi:hypothetical protein
VRAPQIALLAGLALIAMAIGADLSRSPAVLARSNAAGYGTPVAVFAQPGGVSQTVDVCQGNEQVPAGTTAIRLSLEALLGPRLSVEVLSNRAVLTRGTTGAGWSDEVVTVPVKRVASATRDATVCFKFVLRDETVTMNGAASPPAVAAVRNGSALPGRLNLEYLRPGNRSWLSQASSIVQRMGLGHAWSGTWIAPILLLLMLGVAALVSWQARNDLR